MNAPLEGSIAIPAAIAAASSENVRLLGGRSSSVAVAVNDSRVSSSTVLLPIAPRFGALLTSLTVMEIVSESVPPFPSDTVIVAGNVPGP